MLLVEAFTQRVRAMMTVIPAQAGIQNLLFSPVQFLDPGMRRGDAISRQFNTVDFKKKPAEFGWSSLKKLGRV